MDSGGAPTLRRGVGLWEEIRVRVSFLQDLLHDADSVEISCLSKRPQDFAAFLLSWS